MEVIVVTPPELSELIENAYKKGYFDCIKSQDLGIESNRWYRKGETAKFLGVSLWELEKIPYYVLSYKKEAQKHYLGADIQSYLCRSKPQELNTTK